jgi:hypothetical protein
VHPILADGRRLAAYAAAALPLAMVTTGVLTRGPRGLPPLQAVAAAVPLALVALMLLLPVWYVCRALPLQGAPLARLLTAHGLGALFTSAAWVYLGEGIVRFAAAYGSESDRPELYEGQVQSLLPVGALLYLVAASLYYVHLAVEATQRAEQQSLELTVLAREAELRALKAQVHPHFLYNSLNSISSLTTGDPARAREMCILLAEFFRKSLALGERPSVSLEEELAVAQAYLGIESMRFGPRLRVEEAVDEAARPCRLPPLLLQPLVENSIRHGIATCAEGGVLRLEARADGQRLRLLVENPFDPESPTRPGVGLGLPYVRGRLLARYGERAWLAAERSGGLFRVTLLLPVEGDA